MTKENLMRLTALIRRAAVGLGAAGVLLLTAGVAHAAPAADDARYCVAEVTSEQVKCYGSAERAQAGNTLVLKAWRHINYRGDSYTLYSTPCTLAYDNELDKRIANLAWIGMNNAISSWQTYGLCRVRFYDPVNFGSPTTPLSYFNIDCRDMRICFGTNWNDRASSLGLT